MVCGLQWPAVRARPCDRGFFLLPFPFFLSAIGVASFELGTLELAFRTDQARHLPNSEPRRRVCFFFWQKFLENPPLRPLR
jgi:hypothetical protein